MMVTMSVFSEDNSLHRLSLLMIIIQMTKIRLIQMPYWLLWTHYSCYRLKQHRV